MRALVAASVGLTVTFALAGRARVEQGRRRLHELTSTGGWRVPERVRRRLAAALRSAAVDVEPEAAVELTAGVAATATILVLVVAPPLALPAALSVPVTAVVALHIARHRRDRRTEAALPDALEQVSAELRGGGTVVDAVVALAVSDGPLGDDLARVSARTDLGQALHESLAAWTDESDLHGVRATAGALAVASTLGGQAADAVEGLAASLRERLAVTAEARSLATQARLSAVVVGVAPLGYLVMSALVDPQAVLVLTGTAIGRICLVGGLVLEALAALWMRRLVRVEV
ncbi:MAG: type II secretion system F family protein [Acidimicrobiia bacterium]